MFHMRERRGKERNKAEQRKRNRERKREKGGQERKDGRKGKKEKGRGAERMNDDYIAGWTDFTSKIQRKKK